MSNYKESEHYYEYDRNDPDRQNPFLNDELKKIRDEGGFGWTPTSEKTIHTTLPVDEDGILTLTDEILEVTGWKAGDELEWINLKDGSFQLRKTTSVNEDT